VSRLPLRWFESIDAPLDSAVQPTSRFNATTQWIRPVANVAKSQLSGLDLHPAAENSPRNAFSYPPMASSKRRSKG
jgi:hypothetical protein